MYPNDFRIFKYDYSMSRDKKVMIDDHDYEVSGNRLRKLRESLVMTLEAVASVAGTSRAMVHDWETGDKKIPSGKAILIADHFHVTLDYLFCRSNQMIEVEAQGYPFNQLSETGQSLLIEYLDLFFRTARTRSDHETG